MIQEAGSFLGGVNQAAEQRLVSELSPRLILAPARCLQRGLRALDTARGSMVQGETSRVVMS